MFGPSWESSVEGFSEYNLSFFTHDPLVTHPCLRSFVEIGTGLQHLGGILGGFWAIPSASIPERGHHGHHSSVLEEEVSSPRQGPWAERLGLFWKNWLNPQKQQYRVRAGRRYQWTKDSCSMYYTSTITRIQSTTSRDIAPQ